MKKFLLFSLVVLSACGTLFSGTTQEVVFDSNAAGTTVFIDGMEICTTPCKTTIDRSADAVQLVAKKKGYNDRVMTLRSTVNRTAFFNLTSWPSWLTDAVSGGVWEYKNNQVYLQMERKGLSAAAQEAFDRESKAKYFALINYDELMIEAAAGKNGEYLQALSALSGQGRDSLSAALLASRGEVDFVQAEDDFKRFGGD